MKSNLTRTILDWVLATSLLLSVIFFVQYFFRTKDLRGEQVRLQTEMARYQNNHGVLNLLVNDVVEYGKRNPDINRILEGFSRGPVPAAAAAPAPAPAPKTGK